MKKAILATTVVAALGGCVTYSPDFPLQRALSWQGWPETRALSGPIDDAKAPVLKDLRSMQVQDLMDGSVQKLQVSQMGNGIRVQQPDGCTWTRSYDWFAPSDSFARCGSSKDWHTGQATVQRSGSLFPLRVGNRAGYQREAVSFTGKTSTRRTQCDVRDIVEVMRPGNRPTPAFVVSCGDGRITRLTWYAPGEGPIAYREMDRKRVRAAWLRVE